VSNISAIPLPNPVAEQNRKAVNYDYATSGLDYNVGSYHLVEGTHYVFGTDEQVEGWLKG